MLQLLSGTFGWYTRTIFDDTSRFSNSQLHIWSQATFTVGLGGVSVIDFNAQRQAAFAQATAGFMGIAQTLLKISSIDGVAYNRR